MQLETKRLIIRPFTLEDLDPFFDIMGDPEVMRFSVGGVRTRDQAREFLVGRVLKHHAEHGFSLLAIIHKEQNRLIGSAGLIYQSIDEEDLVELGYRFIPTYWGQGYATEAARAIAEYGFQELHLNQIISIIDPENTRSLGVASRIGMRFWKNALFKNIPVHIYALKKKRAWSIEEIQQANQENMYFLMTYFASDAPTMETIRFADVSVVRSQIHDDTFNYVLFAQFDERDASDRIDHVLHLFQQKELPFSWWVSASDSPRSLTTLLQEKGLLFKEKNIGMYKELTDFIIPPCSSQLNFQRVDSSAQLRDFADIITSIGGSPDAFDAIYSQLPPAVYSGQAPVEMYVGYFENVPAVTGMLATHAAVAGIYYVATAPLYRKKGFGTAMMNHLLNRAVEKGHTMSVLQASPDGLSLHEKLGFKPCSTFWEYAPKIEVP